LFLIGYCLKKSSPLKLLGKMEPNQAVSEEKIFLTLANQKKELILVAMFVGRMESNEEAL
jgi:hypothetical protein